MIHIMRSERVRTFPVPRSSPWRTTTTRPSALAGLCIIHPAAGMTGASA
jgi:hypothetical protein